MSERRTSLAVNLAFRRRHLALDVVFDLTHPWTCLFGASGSGKSTILRMIAGLEYPDSGTIRLRPDSAGETILFDSAARVSVKPHRRPIRIMGQQAWLFPGTVLRNVAYGVSSKDQLQAVESILERLALTSLRNANVQALSGGERQRVAIARTVAAAIHGSSLKRTLLLLDEPFTGMDARLRDELALALRALLAEHQVPVLSVTHDIGEVFLLEAEVIRLSAGRIVRQGLARQVLAEERQKLRSLLDPPDADS